MQWGGSLPASVPPKTLTDRILAELADGPGTYVEIAAALGASAATVSALLSQLRHRGRIKVTGHGARTAPGKYPAMYAVIPNID